LAERDRVALREALREQTARMRNLIEQLLALSRFDLAAIRVAPELIRLRPRIDELVRAQVGSRPDAVTVAVAPDLEALVDPTALDRMLSNLVANALRHGEPPVTVTAARHDTHLRLAVEDRGEGVSGEWQIVGWFASFRPAMSTACSLEPARLSVDDLEAAPEVEPEAKLPLAPLSTSSD